MADDQPSLLGWGANTLGQAGLKEGSGGAGPLPIELFNHSRAPAFVACGYHHTLIGSQDGILYSAGKNDDSQLGRGGRPDELHPVPSLEVASIVGGAAGSTFSVVVDSKGQVYTFGTGTRGQLGLGMGSTEATVQIPRLVKALRDTPIACVAAGAAHVLALGRNGDVYAWGENTQGQLGIGTFMPQHTPQLVSTLRGKGIVSVVVGSNHSLALTAAGNVYGFGSNSHGQLAREEAQPVVRPALIRFFRGKAICQIAAGDFHSCARSHTGQLYVFGGGKAGQLGLGINQERVTTPRLVSDLEEIGSVQDVAAGRRHTIAVLKAHDSDASLVFTFGSNNAKQLGLARDHNSYAREDRNVPVRMMRLDVPVGRVYSGGDHAFLSLASQQPTTLVPPDATIAAVPVTKRIKHGCSMDSCDPLMALTPLSLSTVNERVVKCFIQSGRLAELQRLVATCFSSISCLNASFVDHDRIFHDNGALFGFPCVDMASVRATYNALFCAGPEIVTAMGHAMSSMLSHMKQTAITEPEDVAYALVIMENPLLLHPEKYHPCLEALAKWVLGLSQVGAQMVAAAWRDLPSTYFYRVVQVFQGYLSYLLRAHAAAEEPIAVTVMLLDRLYTENNESRIIPTSSFYNDAVPERVDLGADFQHWLQAPHAFTFSKYPFLIRPDLKANLLRVGNALVMASSIASNIFFEQGSGVFQVTVRREHLLVDTWKILTAPVSVLTCPLQVKFEGEEGVDQGGLKKEFFQLALTQIYQKYFEPLSSEAGEWLWFGQTSPEKIEAYRLSGILLGLAVHNSVLIEPLFPPVLYKMLLSDMHREILTMDDLRTMCPEVARNLQSLLEYSSHDVESVFSLTFEETVEVAKGQYATHELKPGGADIPVTAFNRDEYVRLYINYFLYGKCAAGFDAYKAGFLSVCGRTRALEMFRPGELELVCSGTPDWDLHELEKSAKYMNYTPEDNIIKWFWELVHSWSGPLKRKFLTFCTGSARVPIRGFKDFPFFIQKVADETRLPVAHTCFNLLDLPGYASKEALERNLVLAINETEGFGIV